MKKFDGIGRRRCDDRIVDAVPHDDRAHRHRAVRQPLGDRYHVGHYAYRVGRKTMTEPPESGYDFIEDEQ
ncbi:hypothetical protein D3C83_260980 [compost metagenome]